MRALRKHGFLYKIVNDVLFYNFYEAQNVPDFWRSLDGMYTYRIRTRTKYFRKYFTKATFDEYGDLEEMDYYSDKQTVLSHFRNYKYNNKLEKLLNV